jgi:hypothetical protein
MASSGGWLLPEQVDELPDLGLGVAAMPTQGLHEALLHLARRCRRRIAKWSRFPSRRLSEVLKAINPGIDDGVQGFWWRTPV